MIGQTILHYEITEKLGEGGMGVVYKARDTKLGRTVALKFLPESLTPTEEDKQRFIREAKAAAALNHPNICTIYSVHEYEDRQFISMEYIEGEMLRTKIDDGDLTLETALEYATKIAEALAEAHEQDIIHRDIKPENIMVDAKERIKVMDFGLAKLKQGREITKTGDTVGTLAYSSPEQIRGQQVDHRSDLFSLGIVLYEMLTGSKPFQGEHQAAMTYSIVNEEPAPMETYLPDVPGELSEFLDKCLAKAPDERMESASQVAEMLKNLKESVNVLVQQPYSTEGKSEANLQGGGSILKAMNIKLPKLNIGRSALSKRTLWVGIVGIILLAIALWGGWWFTGGVANDEKISIDENRVAVFPFTVRGSEELSYLGEGMVELMSRSIDGAGPLKAVDPKALLTQIKLESSSEGIGPGVGREVAAGFDAGRYILGSILRLGNDIRLSATWYGPDGEIIGSAEVTAESEEEIQEGIDALTRHAISDLADEEANHRQRLAAQTTSSSEALKAYLEGQEARRSYKWQAAQNAFERAVEIDSSFALAYYGLSWAAGWNFKIYDALSAAERAAELSDNLPERDQLVIEAHHAFYQGRANKAERLYRQVIETHQGDVDAWHGLGETLYHFNEVRGQQVTESKRALQRAFELDPSHSEPLMHLVHIAAMERDLAALDSLTTIPASQNIMGAFQRFFRDIRAFMYEQEPVPEPEELSDRGTLFASVFLAQMGQFEKAKEPLRILTAEARDPEIKIEAQLYLSQFFIVEGKLTAAREQIARLGELDMTASLSTRAELAVLPFLPEDGVANEDRDYLLDRLATWDADTVTDKSRASMTRTPLKAYSSFRLYLLGLLRAEEGNIDAAQNIAADLKKQKSPQIFSSLSSDLSRGVMAEAARQEGNREKALKQLEAIELEGSLGLSPFYSGARERFLRAELLAEAERFEEALVWYETFESIGGDNYPYIAPAQFGRAQVLEKLGQEQEAADAYKRFIDLWVDADSVLQPMVDTAKERLEQLNQSKTLTDKIGD